MNVILTLGSGLVLALGAAAGQAPHWGYEGAGGPDNWGKLSPKFAVCGTGKAQSPVDLARLGAHGTDMVETNYHSGPLTVLNNGHTVQANFAPGSTMTSGGHNYKLVQVHFHTPSEHEISGKHYPLVAHFVHADASGKLAVLGVLFKEGAANTELTKLIAAAPDHKQAAYTVDGASFDPNGLLPKSLKVFRYAGSLTTPPCSEGVNWNVAETPVTASAKQIAALHAIMGDNARPVQPLNGRTLIGK